MRPFMLESSVPCALILSRSFPQKARDSSLTKSPLQAMGYHGMNGLNSLKF